MRIRNDYARKGAMAMLLLVESLTSALGRMRTKHLVADRGLAGAPVGGQSGVAILPGAVKHVRVASQIGIRASQG